MPRGVPASGSRRPAGATRPENSEIAEFIGYDPHAGTFWWKKTAGPARVAGASAGTIWRRGSTPRRIIVFRGRPHRAARVAWLIMTGEWPPVLVDHKDTDGLNDRWSNLRLATKAQNNTNQRRRADNTSGFKGVHRQGDYYVARIQHEGRRIALGCFPTPEEAHDAYRVAAADLHQEFGRTS